MDLAEVQVSRSEVARLIELLQKKGVALWCEYGQLRYRAPHGALSLQDLEMLRGHRATVLSLLECGGAQWKSSAVSEGVQLTFSQLAHWNWYRLSDRPAIRQIASVTRILGPLQVDVLNESLVNVVSRHGSLRTLILPGNGAPAQIVSASSSHGITRRELSALSSLDSEVEVQRRIRELIMQPINPAIGPLFEAELLQLRKDEHVLLVVMEHMISDAQSMEIFLKELLGGYAHRITAGVTPQTSDTFQFTDYATLQRCAHGSWLAQHASYWANRSPALRRVRFPDGGAGLMSLGWGAAPIAIDRDTKRALQEWATKHRTTIVMSVFVAYVALILRWCDAAEAVVIYQSDGRTHPDYRHSIGLYAAPVYVLVALYEDDNFLTLLERVTKEYCAGYENIDFSYFASRKPRPEFTRSAAFNWVPSRGEPLVPVDSPSRNIELSAIEFDHPMMKGLELDHDPFVLLFDEGHRVLGDVHFPLSRFSHSTMEKFARNLVRILRYLVACPERRIKDHLILR